MEKNVVAKRQSAPSGSLSVSFLGPHVRGSEFPTRGEKALCNYVPKYGSLHSQVNSPFDGAMSFTFLLLFRFVAVSIAAFHYSKFAARAERIGSNGIGRLLVVRIEYRSRHDEN